LNRIHFIVVAIAVVVSLFVGGVAGFFLGIASTKAGKAFLADIVQDEQKADVSSPKKIVRERFQLQYPANWKIDVDDEDYDPDQMFSIDSPGSAFVMFIIGTAELDPEEHLQIQIRHHEKLMGRMSIDRFEKYGRFRGKGATLKGRIMGSRTTVKLFAFQQGGLSLMIAQQCPDEDLKRVQDGLNLIETSFALKATNKTETAERP
jgi:hypothetical protein